jgi:cell division septation protein DedD
VAIFGCIRPGAWQQAPREENFFADRRVQERSFIMPWRNNGDYYSFKPDSIIQHAPTVSGVYGLFNFRHQIVIGNAANVRDALLHHRRHTKFRFSRFEPTGFTFEICPPERRENRTQELIKEYNPISSPQTSIGIAMLYRSWRTPEARAFNAEVTSEKKPTRNKVVALPAKPAKAKAPLHLNAERLGLAGALCGMIFVAVGLIGLAPHLKYRFHSVMRNATTIAEPRRQIDSGKIQLAQAESPTATESTDNTVIAAEPSAAAPAASVNLNTEATTSSPTGSHTAAAQATAAAAVASPKPQTLASEHPAKREAPANAWSVQAMATTDKPLAHDWLQKLKTKGYEAFVIDAEINGNTWHRLRIGTFDTRQDAENLRAALIAKEGFHDAYVTGNDKPATTIALNRR